MAVLGSSAGFVDGSCVAQFQVSAMDFGRWETADWVPIDSVGWRAGNWIVAEVVACVEAVG